MNSKNNSSKVINLLTICRRAGKVIMGFDLVKEKAFNGDVFCILTATDLSPKSIKEVNFISQQTDIPFYQTEIEMSEFEKILGKRTGIIGIIDEGFSDAFRKIFNDR